MKERNCEGDNQAYCKEVDADHAFCQCVAGYEGDALPDGPSCKRNLSLLPSITNCWHLHHSSDRYADVQLALRKNIIEKE